MKRLEYEYFIQKWLVVTQGILCMSWDQHRESKKDPENQKQMPLNSSYFQGFFFSIHKPVLYIIESVLDSHSSLQASFASTCPNLIANSVLWSYICMETKNNFLCGDLCVQCICWLPSYLYKRKVPSCTCIHNDYMLFHCNECLIQFLMF